MKFKASLFCVFLATAVCACCYGGVTAELYYADGNTPLEYSDIMVGTQLKIIITSTESVSFNGKLVFEDANVVKSDLSEADPSVLDDAGVSAYVSIIPPTNAIEGYSFSTYTNQAGEWFAFNYDAVELGYCETKLYEAVFVDPYQPPVDQLIQSVELNHVKSRDVVENYAVGFDDFALFAEYWQVDDCGADVNCLKVDFDDSNSIDVVDLMGFADYWLEKTR